MRTFSDSDVATDFSTSKSNVAETLKNLDKCKLCDSILVYFTPFEFKTTAKIVKTEYDVLLEKYNKIELGTIKKSIADLFSGKNIGGV